MMVCQKIFINYVRKKTPRKKNWIVKGRVDRKVK
jgi:hypothetical protein